MGLQFAAKGFAFVLVDSRGRGDSAGDFRVASVYPGVDFPMRGNDFYPYVARWLTVVSGRPIEDRTFLDNDYWTAPYRDHFERGRAFSSLTPEHPVRASRTSAVAASCSIALSVHTRFCFAAPNAGFGFGPISNSSRPP